MTASAYDLTEPSVFDATNELAEELSERDQDYKRWREAKDLLLATDNLLWDLEQLMLDGQKMLPRYASYYPTIRDLCEHFDVDFRTKLCKQTMHAMDALYEVQARVMVRVCAARDRLQRWEPKP